MQLTKKEVLEKANLVSKNTLMETLSIEMIDFGDDFLIARMPVTSKVYQPDGILHGGATVALAESVGSFASHIFLDSEKLFIRGIETSKRGNTPLLKKIGESIMWESMELRFNKNMKDLVVEKVRIILKKAIN